MLCLYEYQEISSHPLLYRWIQIRIQNRLRILHQWRLSPTTVSGTLSPYFRLNSLPSIPAFLSSLSFSSSSLIPFPLSKPCRTLIHLTLYTYPPPHLHSLFSGSQDTLISLSMTQLTLLQNSLSFSLQSLIPFFPLPMMLKLIIAH